MGRVRSFGLGLGLLVGACAPVLLSPGTACAASPHAALVVDTGARTTTYCVALDASSVSGTHLIELASAQFGLDYRFGFAGRAICRLDGVGVDGDDCFGAYPDYWGYFHGDPQGGWAWATGSAADHMIDAGEVEGWSWGVGDSAAAHPAPPELTIDEVCEGFDTDPPSPAPAPSPTPDVDSGTGDGTGDEAGGSGTQADGADPPGRSPTTSPSPPSRSSTGNAPDADPEASAGYSPAAAAPGSASPDVVRAAAEDPPASDGPPIGGLVTLGAIALLATAGSLMLRRRRGGS